MLNIKHVAVSDGKSGSRTLLGCVGFVGANQSLTTQD